MEIVQCLKAKNVIDPEIEAEYASISSVRNTYPIHRHDYFEVFLISDGSVMHCINGNKLKLDSGALVFIRPDDIHYYEQVADCDCRFINLTFLKNTVNELFDYLGDGFPKSQFLKNDMPPVVQLPKQESEYLRIRINELHIIPQSEKMLIKAKLRALLSEILCKYLLSHSFAESPDRPVWLSQLCNEMKSRDNFSCGVEKLVDISGKSHAYLCRIFKKYFAITPTIFINDLRFGYAESLLLKTDMNILDICSDIGIENLGYFYKEFKKRFRYPPASYRKVHKAIMK